MHCLGQVPKRLVLWPSMPGANQRLLQNSSVVVGQVRFGDVDGNAPFLEHVNRCWHQAVIDTLERRADDDQAFLGIYACRLSAGRHKPLWRLLTGALQGGLPVATTAAGIVSGDGLGGH